jgi:phosphoglucosamine mutase
MANYFGTDGIRGIVNEGLTSEIAYKCGNALCSIKKKPMVIIGRDTRRSGDMIKLSIASGITTGGGNVIDMGIIPTAAVAYLTKFYKADFGVVISASHNPKEFNGIKIFGCDGYKIGEELEEKIEYYFNLPVLAKPDKLGCYKADSTGKKLYENYLINSTPKRLDGLKVVLDCANGAGSEVAVSVFEHLGAMAISINTDLSGDKINENCGSLHIESLKKSVIDNKAAAGFAYDGDSDRLICCDETGNVVDGDKLIFIFASEYGKNNKLIPNSVVGTSHTNMGIEKALKNKNINLLRSDIGDKYVMELMLKTGSIIGGEQSGHIIFSECATTGDGILSSLQLASMLSENKLSDLAKVKLFPQTNINVKVKDKLRVLGSEHLAEEIEKQRLKLGNKGRIVVRASGTEPLIRVFSETEDQQLCDETAKAVEKVIKLIEEL